MVHVGVCGVLEPAVVWPCAESVSLVAVGTQTAGNQEAIAAHPCRWRTAAGGERDPSAGVRIGVVIVGLCPVVLVLVVCVVLMPAMVES